MSTPSSSTPSIATSSSVADTGSKSSPVPIIVGVIVAVVLLAAPLAWFLIRRHRRMHASTQEIVSSSIGRREVAVDPAHIAARVTPFAVSGNGEPIGPQFNHRPGQGMRIAIRRDDGGWEFSDPSTVGGTPITPFSRASMSNCPSPTASTYSYAKKDKARPGELTTRGYVETDVDGLAPPAYDDSQV